VKPKPFPIAQRLLPLFQKGMKSQWRVPISTHVAEFTTASREFWQHGDFGLARPDPGDADRMGEHLRVPCKHEHGRCKVCDEKGWPETTHRLYPRMMVGQILWIQEAWGYWKGAPLAPGKFVANPKTGEAAVWSVDHNGIRSQAVPKWRPGPQMPRWASRYTMKVVSVRIERLHHITEQDARAEGMIPYQGGWVCGLPWDGMPLGSAVEAFRWQWDSSKSPGFRSDPWVVRIECDVYPGNIDRIKIPGHTP
jgi:hypothetical protein